MTNPYRAMCAELVDACVRGGNLAESIFRARALLAQPVGEGPSDEEIEGWADACPDAPLEEMDPEIHGWQRCFTAKEFSETIRAALIHWGHPTPQPEPPTPISAHDLAIQWNRQADQSEQWDSLELYEQLAFAQARAIAADRARRIP